MGNKRNANARGWQVYTVQVWLAAGNDNGYSYPCYTNQHKTMRAAVRTARRRMRLAYQWAGCWPVGLRAVVATPQGRVYTLHPQYKVN